MVPAIAPGSADLVALAPQSQYRCFTASLLPLTQPVAQDFSDRNEIQPHGCCRFLLPGVRADELRRGQDFCGGAVKDVQRAATNDAGVLLREFYCLGEETPA